MFSKLSGRFSIEKREKWPVAEVNMRVMVHRVVPNPQNQPFPRICGIQAG
jgi:hypothetical protein